MKNNPVLWMMLLFLALCVVGAALCYSFGAGFYGGVLSVGAILFGGMSIWIGVMTNKKKR